MISPVRILCAVLPILVLAGCTGDGEEREPDAAAPPPPAAEPQFADLPERMQVRKDLRAAVRDPDSQEVPPLPGNPVIGSLHALQPEESRCIATYGWDSAEEGCVFGPVGVAHDIVLWGDEQAAQWLPALTDVAVHTGRRVRLFAKYECPPLVGLTPWLATENRVHVECRVFNDKTLAAIAADPPDVVLVSGGIRGTAFVVDGRVVETGVSGPGDRWRPVPGARDVWHRGLESSLAALEDLGVRTVVVGEVPALGMQPGVCFARHPKRPERCSARTEDVLLEDHAATVEDLAREHAATYVDPVQWLCTRTVCPGMAGDTFTYRDSLLVTPAYARRLARVLGEEAGLLPQE